MGIVSRGDVFVQMDFRDNIVNFRFVMRNAKMAPSAWLQMFVNVVKDLKESIVNYVGVYYL